MESSRTLFRSFAFLIWALLGFYSASLQAQISAAAGRNHAGVRQAGNATPVIDITTPNKNGISTEDFNQFSVSRNGVIFNNDFLPSRTQLAGIVKHNPNMSWGDYARLIISQVVGADPSNLNGPIEIAGPRADLVIANPNGISVNGARAYNVSRLSLAAGNMQNGAKGDFTLQIGSSYVHIGRGGLNVLTIDDVTVMGKNILLDGPLQAGFLLQVLSGERFYDYKTRVSTRTGKKGQSWGIDASALGAMSAGQIILQSTDKGVGVRVKSKMAASAGDVMISADGRIRLKGSIQSNHRVIVQSTSGRIKDSGQTMASGAIIYQSAAGIQTEAQMESGSYVQLDAGAGNWTNSGTLFTNGVLLASAGGAGVNSGEINAVKGVAAQFLTARNLGKIESQNSITIQTTGNLTNASQIVGEKGVALISRSGGLTQSGRVESASGDILEYAGGGSLEHIGVTLGSGRAILSATGDLTVSGIVVANGGLNLIGGGNTMLDGTIATQGDLVAVAGNGSLTNHSSLTAGGTVELDTNGALQSTEELVSGNNLYLNAQSVSLAKGASAAAGGLQVSASSSDITTGALLTAAKNLILTAGGNVTLHGGLSAGGSIGIESGGNVTDTQAWIASSRLAVIATGNMEQMSGIYATRAAIEVGRNLQLAGVIQTVQSFGAWVGGTLQNAARIVSGGAIGLNVQGDLTNSGSLQSAQAIALTTAGNLNNTGAINAEDQARLVAQGTLTNSAEIQSGNGILIQTATGDLTNGGRLQSLSDIVVSSGSALANSGLIQSNTNVELDAVITLTNTGAAQVGGVLSYLSTGSITNSADLEAVKGLQLVAQNRSVTSQGNLSSGDGLQFQAGGDLIAEGNLSAQTDLLAHAGGNLAMSGAANLGGKADIAANGKVLFDENLDAGDDVQILSANGAVNTIGSIQTAHGIAIGAGANIFNLAALTAGTDIAIAAGNGVATTARIVAGNNVAISSGTGTTTNQGTIEAGNILDVEGDALANNSGSLHSLGDITIAVVHGIDNANGTIEAGHNINIASGDYTGAGGWIQSGWDTVIASTGAWNNDNGTIQAGRSLQFQAASGSNVNGSMIAGTSARPGDLLINITGGGFDNTKGTLAGARHVLIDTGGGFNNTSGRITAGVGDLVWQAGGPVENNDATVQVGRNFELQVNGGNGFDNSGGRITVTGDSQLGVTGSFANAGGNITTGNNLALIVNGNLSNTNGTIRAGTDIAAFNIGENADNTAGTIAAGGLFAGNVAQTFTQAGTLVVNGQIQLYAGTLNNTGSIRTRVLAVTGGTLTNSGSILADLGSSIDFNQVILNTGSVIESLYGPVQIVAEQGTFTNAGTIAAGQDIVLQANGGGLTNSGQVLADNNVTIAALGQITNTGIVSAAEDLSVNAAGYEILNNGGEFLAGHDARLDAGSFVNTTSGGGTDTGWEHYAVIYPDGTGIGKGLPGGVSPPHGYYGELALMLNYIRIINYQGPPGIVSAGNDLVINTINGGENQASQIVAGGTVTLTGSWQNVGNGTYFGKNWLLVYQAAERANGNTDSLNGNDRYRPVGVKGGNKGAETDIAIIGDGWDRANNFWDYIDSPFFAWNPATSSPTQSPWIFKDALYPGKIDGMTAHDFFGVADSLKLKFVITPTPPTNDARHLDFNDKLGTPAVIEGFGGTNVNVQDNGLGVSDVGAGGKPVGPVAPSLQSANVGPVAEPVGELPPAPALTSVPDLKPGSISLGLAPPKVQAITGPVLAASDFGLQSIPQAPAPSVPSVRPLFATAPASFIPAGLQTIGINQAGSLGLISANVQTIPGQDFAAQVIFDASPELQFNFFDSYWTPAGHDAIELSPELQALLARDPIPDHSPIRALDHLLGKVFTDSALLDWAHNLKPAVNATDPGQSLFAGVQGLGIPDGYKSRADWLANLKAADLAEKAKGLFTSSTLFAGLNGVVPHGINIQQVGSRPDFVALVQSHQAWIAQNFPGFYSWQHKVEQQVQKKIDAENQNSVLQIVGLVVAAVVVVVLSVLSYGAFSGFAAAVMGSLGTAIGASAAATAVATVAFTGFLMGAAFGPLAPTLSALIGTGNIGQAFSAGVTGGLIGMATGLLGGFAIGQFFSGAVQSIVSASGYYLTDVGNTILSGAAQVVQSAVQGFENSMASSFAQSIETGRTGAGLFKQWGFAALLAGATAAVAFSIGHIIPWDQIGGPKINTPMTQEVAGYTASGQPIYQPMTLGEILIKPALEGLGEYGIGSALGVQDPEALGIGAAAGGYIAPFAINGVRLSLGSFDQTTYLFNQGNTSYNSYVANSLSGQLTSIAGGIAASVYDGNYQMGAYGANQIFQNNDKVVIEKKQNADGLYNVDVIDDNTGTVYRDIGESTTPDASGQLINLSLAAQESNLLWDGESIQDVTGVLQNAGAFLSLVGNHDPVYWAVNGLPGSINGNTVSAQVPADSTTYYSYSAPTATAIGAGYVNGTPAADGSTQFPATQSLNRSSSWTENEILGLGGLGYAVASAGTGLSQIQSAPSVSSAQDSTGINAAVDVSEPVNGVAPATDAAESGVPAALRSGQLAEGSILDSIGSTGKVAFTPTADQINSAAFQVIVGDARYTATGAPVSTIFDAATAAGLAEVKTGSSVLNSSYQLRLQTYASLVTEQPFTLYTSRPINAEFSQWLSRWGVGVQPLP